MVTVAANTRAMTQSRVPGAAAMSSLCSTLMGRRASVGEASGELSPSVMGVGVEALGNQGIGEHMGPRCWAQNDWRVEDPENARSSEGQLRN